MKIHWANETEHNFFGEFFIQSGNGFFPWNNWTDFYLFIVSEWLSQLLENDHKQDSEFIIRFMDGDYCLLHKKNKDQVLVKGIFEEQEKDFTDHGMSRDLGRIYGVVPENPNLQWERFLDEDGVEREYACVDVLLYTSLYQEASAIPGKSQSMEIYAPSIRGDWELINGRKLFKYTDGCFLGLQVLGENVEPCFEGAAFFSLYQSLLE